MAALERSALTMPRSLWANACLQSSLGSHTCSSEHTCQQLQMLSHLLSTANNPAASLCLPRISFAKLQMCLVKSTLCRQLLTTLKPLYTFWIILAACTAGMLFVIPSLGITVELLCCILSSNQIFKNHADCLSVQEVRVSAVSKGRKNPSCAYSEPPLTSLPPPRTVQFQCQHYCSSARLPKPT